jgi:hypothetical protein
MEQKNPDKVGKSAMSSKSASNRAKQKWNANHYAQIKVSVNREIASEFKAACVSSNISMAKVLSDYMQKYIQSPSKAGEKSTEPNLTTRNLTKIRKLNAGIKFRKGYSNFYGKTRKSKS